MKWFHWVLVALAIVAVIVIAIKSSAKGNPDSLEKARQAKEDKRILSKVKENGESELREEIKMEENPPGNADATT